MGGGGWVGERGCVALLASELRRVFVLYSQTSLIPPPPPPPRPPPLHSRAQALERCMYEELRGAAEYFGEDWAPADASRLLRTLRDFGVLFDKGVADIKVRRGCGCGCGCSGGRRCLRGGGWEEEDG